MSDAASQRKGSVGKPWKPGQSGNPSGGSRALRERAVLTRLLREAVNDDAGRRIVEAVRARAEDGDMRAVEILFDRLDGPVPRDLHVSGSLTLADAAAAIAEGCQPEGDE